MRAFITVGKDWQLGVLLRGEADCLRAWIELGNARRFWRSALLVLAGAGLFGGAMGYWRAPKQALFVAIKLPLILLLTTLGNALLNAMLAPLLGLRLSVRQTSFAILTSFVMAATILGAFSPLALFVVWNAPPLTATAATSSVTYSFVLLLHVSIIALAGIMANLRLFQFLREMSGSAFVARRVIVAWLAGNLFLGSQISWILRPFIGAPDLPVQFLRHTAFRGNFYETVFHSLMRVLHSNL